MKKSLSTLLIIGILVLGFGGYKFWNYYQDTYVGKDYYAVVKEPLPKETDIKGDNGKTVGTGYEYEVDGYDKYGKSMKINFDVITTGSYRNGDAYAAGTVFKIEASKNRVIQKTVITQKEIPSAIKDKVLHDK